MDIPLISSAGLPTGTVNGFDYGSTQQKILFDEWDSWAKQAPTGGSEHRDKAVKNLKDCLERNAVYLNLNCLNLSSLPESLPPGVLQLKASGNAITALP